MLEVWGACSQAMMVIVYAFLAAMMIFWLSLLAFESFIKWMIGK